MLPTEKLMLRSCQLVGYHVNASMLESVYVKRCSTTFWKRVVMLQAFALLTCESRLAGESVRDQCLMALLK